MSVYSLEEKLQWELRDHCLGISSSPLFGSAMLLKMGGISEDTVCVHVCHYMYTGYNKASFLYSNRIFAMSLELPWFFFLSWCDIIFIFVFNCVLTIDFCSLAGRLLWDHTLIWQQLQNNFQLWVTCIFVKMSDTSS